MKKQSFFIYLALFLAWGIFMVASEVFSASLSFSPSSGGYEVGDIFTVKIILNTEGERVQGWAARYLNYDPEF